MSMKSRVLKRISLIMAFAMFFSCMPVSAQQVNSSVYLQNDSYDSVLSSEQAYADYFLAMGDTIDVHLLIGDNALSLDYTFLIGNDGTIFFPNIGTMKLSGLKIKEAEQAMSRELSKKFKEPFLISVVLKDPRLTKVFLSQDEYVQSLANIDKFVYVYGEVFRPGRNNFFAEKKLSDYINLAGGPATAANLSYVTVTRNENGKSKSYYIDAYNIMFKGDGTDDMRIIAGDVIQVPKNWFYFSDFASFANMVLLSLTFYATVSNSFRR